MNEDGKACRLRMWRERASIDAATIAALVDMPLMEYLRCESGQHTMWLADREALRYLFDDRYGIGFLLGTTHGAQSMRELDAIDAAFRATCSRWQIATYAP